MQIAVAGLGKAAKVIALSDDGHELTGALRCSALARAIHGIGTDQLESGLKVQLEGNLRQARYPSRATRRPATPQRDKDQKQA